MAKGSFCDRRGWHVHVLRNYTSTLITNKLVWTWLIRCKVLVTIINMLSGAHKYSRVVITSLHDWIKEYMICKKRKHFSGIFPVLKFFHTVRYRFCCIWWRGVPRPSLSRPPWWFLLHRPAFWSSAAAASSYIPKHPEKKGRGDVKT